MSKLLDVRNAEVTFTSGFGVEKRALRNVSLVVGGARPAITAVVGESGSGKSTLIRLMLGFQAPTRGEVLYDGMDVTKPSRSAGRAFRREVQAIFQDPFDVFNPFYRIDHPLLSPLRAFRLVRSRDEAYAKIEKVIESVGLTPADTLGKYPHQLSGGQRQRVMIARALLLDPTIILADEPVSMVDASLRSTILEILYGLTRDRGISLIYVTHDLATAYQVADTIVVLHDGHVIEVGAAEDVIHRPAHAYTQALIEAVPSSDLNKPWDLDGGGDRPVSFLDDGEPIALYRTGELRAVASPLRSGEEPTSAAAIQQAVIEAKNRSAGSVL